MIFGVRNWIRVIGALIATAGVMCIPKGPGVHLYYLSLPFSRLVESGSLFRLGVILFLIGAIIFAASFIRDPFRRHSDYDSYLW